MFCLSKALTFSWPCHQSFILNNYIPSFLNHFSTPAPTAPFIKHFLFSISPVFPRIFLLFSAFFFWIFSVVCVVCFACLILCCIISSFHKHLHHHDHLHDVYHKHHVNHAHPHHVNHDHDEHRHLVWHMWSPIVYWCSADRIIVICCTLSQQIPIIIIVVVIFVISAVGVIIVNVVIVVYVDVNAITIIKKSLLLNLVQPMIQYFTLGTFTHDYCDSHIQQPHHKMGKYNSMIMTIIMTLWRWLWWPRW